MTPAEKLAQSKPPRPEPKHARRVWHCRLNELRTELGLSQRDVALAVGMSRGGYCQAENWGDDVKLTTALKLSEFFGVPIAEIWSKP